MRDARFYGAPARARRDIGVIRFRGDDRIRVGGVPPIRDARVQPAEVQAGVGGTDEGGMTRQETGQHGSRASVILRELIRAGEVVNPILIDGALAEVERGELLHRLGAVAAADGIESGRERRPQLLQIRRRFRLRRDDELAMVHAHLAQAKHAHDDEHRNEHRGNRNDPTPSNPHSAASGAKSAP